MLLDLDNYIDPFIWDMKTAQEELRASGTKIRFDLDTSPLKKFAPGLYLGNKNRVRTLVIKDSPLDSAKNDAEFNDVTFPKNGGVCDYPEQVLERWPSLQEDSRYFVVMFSEVRRSDQFATEGWRWDEAWPYIGDKTPQHEHLYDEKDFELIYEFSVYEVDPQKVLVAKS